MRVFSGWKHSKGEPVGNNQFIIEITDGEGTSWYDLMYTLDGRSETYAIGINPDQRISWYTDGKVSEVYTPSDGGIIVLTSTFNPDDAKGLMFNGEAFEPIPVVEPVVRTKEDIMSDLLRLQEELKAL